MTDRRTAAGSFRRRCRQTVLALAAGAFALTAGAAAAETFRYAFQGELRGLDPYTLNETFTLGTLGNVYEGLTRRGPNLEIEPALAESWEVVEPNRWRFNLRKGVTFHDGTPFTADDVIFSADRVRSQESDLKTRLNPEVQVVKVDDHTVDFVLPGPNPILHYEWDTWGIMSKAWAEANDAVKVTSASDESPNYASLHTNGTGPYRLVSHDMGVQTVFEANPDWWDRENKTSNIDRVELVPIASDATRVAALLSGEMDMVYPVPVQDLQRVDGNAGTRALIGPELRTIFLGMDQMRDELLDSNIKGKNPFKDPRVRMAFFKAIDIEAIKSRVMRNLAEPSALMISPFQFALADQFERPAYDPEGAKALLAEAGYPDGFEVGMDCPNDRYVNDEQICQAVTAMLARVGVKVNLNAQTRARYFGKVLQSNGFETSFYLLGWTPGSFDSWNVIANLMKCRSAEGSEAPFNLGGYCNKRVDELADLILVENDPDKRNEMIAEAYRIHLEEAGHIPLHQQGLAWGVADNVDLVQRADNVVLFTHVNKK